MKKALTALAWGEWLAAWLTLLAFWHVSPPIRDRWVGLLILPLVFGGVRLLLTRRWAVTWGWIALVSVFIGLTMFNFVTAPYHRQDYWVLVCRPLAGMWLVAATMLLVQQTHRLRGIVIALVLLGLAIGLLGLTASQWDGKSDPFRAVLDVLPRLDNKQFLTDAQLSFNPNEIAGAMAWLCPLLFGLGSWVGAGRARWVCYAVGAGLLLALFLGQSRFALGGVLAALLVLGICLARGRQRIGLIVVVVLMIGIQVALVRTIPESATPTTADTSTFALSNRDLSSVNTRLQMWQRSLEMVRDYPLTGVGMAMYRAAIRTPHYQIPYFETINFTAPHTHNEWLQIAVDLGLPGLVWYAALHLWVIGCVWRLLRSRDPRGQVIAVAVAAGLGAHVVYGLGDAITLWDRFAFTGWAVIALLAGAYERQKVRYTTT